MENQTVGVGEGTKPCEPDANTLKECSNTTLMTQAVASAENSKENGVEVSGDGKEDLGADVVTVVETTTVVESKIAVKIGGGDETVERLGTTLAGENKVGGDGMGVNDGVSLFVDISKELGNMTENKDRDNGEAGNGDPPNENGESQDGKIREMSEIKDGEEDNEDQSDGEYEFSVGDFVWGKIKSHPWWPGQIYDPSDASDYALKLKQRNRLLVAYFDGTFAWCRSSQLKPFVEEFEKMSKQSCLKNFVNALQNALDEIGRLVELKMSCLCAPKESLVGLERPLADNAGIKQGVLVPEGGIKKLWNSLVGPADCLTQLKHVARVVSMTNLLELTELKHWLLAYYRAKGGYRLVVYHEPQPIPGLEDNEKITRDTSVEVAVKGPVEEDGLSSPSGQTSQSLLQKSSRLSENRQHQRRKQKSIAEILEGDMDVDKTLSSIRKKRKGNEETSGGTISTSKPKRRKVTKLLESTPVTQSEASDTEKDDSGTKEKHSRKKKKSSRAENDGSSDASHASGESKRVQSDDGEAKDHDGKGYLSRERKKSKYLSPPYTSVSGKQSKREVEAEPIKVSSEAQFGQRMSRAAANVIGSSSSPNVKSSDDGLEKKGSKASDDSTPLTPKPDRAKTIDATKVNVPVDEVVSMIRSSAIERNILKENDCMDMVGEFVSLYRSSVYSDGPHREIYNNLTHSGSKRKAVDSRSLTKGQTDQKSHETKIRKTEEAKSEKLKISKQAAKAPEMKAKGDGTVGKGKKPVKSNAKSKEKKKKGKKIQDGDTGDMEADGKDSSELFVSFGPASSLPSKEEIIKIYGKFGALNKKETDMLYNNYCARVVFLRSSDAEVAFESSRIASPFGSAKCSFQLRHSSSPSSSKAKEVKEIPKTAERETPPLTYITQKLENVTAMVENSDEKISADFKSELEGELKSLLEKVRTFMGSSS